MSLTLWLALFHDGKLSCKSIVLNVLPYQAAQPALLHA